jgi:hypothetical protein
MNYIFFIFVNFIVSFISDIVLNDIANKKLNFFNSKIINSLKIYFEKKSIIVSGIYAGITIAFSLIIVTLFSKLFYNFYLPDDIQKLFKFNILAFILGYIIDILIDKLDIFGKSLHKYYDIAGSGFWGAVAFIFSINISYIVNVIFCKLIKEKFIC